MASFFFNSVIVYWVALACFLESSFSYEGNSTQKNYHVIYIFMWSSQLHLRKVLIKTCTKWQW